MAALTYDQVSQILKYDPETGKLFWLPRPPELFLDGTGKHNSAERNAGRWNGRFAGKEAFTAVTQNGYKFGRIFDQGHYAHRIAWLLATKEWPVTGIDHIDGDRANNRLANLREADAAENMKNQKLHAGNVSGAHGVTWCKPLNKWQAFIKVKGAPQFLGYYHDLTEAVAVRKSAETEHGYHHNHGNR